MSQPQNVHQLRTPEQLVSELVDVQDQIAQLTARANGLRAQLGEQVGVGNTLDVNGVKVSVRAPSRRFNLAKATTLLAPAVLDMCRAEGYDAAKIKQFLPPVLLEQCMDEVTGAPVVSVR